MNHKKMKLVFCVNKSMGDIAFLAILQVILILALTNSGVHSCTRRKVKPTPEPAPAPAPDPIPPVYNRDLRCQDEGGRPLQWFIAYKLAKIQGATLSHVRNGLGYTFLTNGTDQWQLSGQSIRDSGSIVGTTLNFLYDKSLLETPSKTLYILYNDQPPNRTSVGYNGHMKGIILANERGGIWIQHSVPKFPRLKDQEEYTYPNNGENNAQLFYCMTLNPQNIDNIVANTLLHTKPIVYDHSVPETLHSVYPNLVKLVAKGRKKNTAPSQMFALIDEDINVTIFAKGPKFEKEIYSEWIAPTLDSSLKVQSWLNGANSLASNCKSKKYQILNISEKELSHHKFSTGKDHSKWAISSQGKWTCISDLNRMESQKSRGGVALCTTNEKIWQSFEKSVLGVQPCGRPQNLTD